MPWNLLVTAQEGLGGDLLRELRRLGRFRWSSFRNVILGAVDDPDAFLLALDELIERKPFVGAWVGKTLPIDVTFDVDVERFVADAQERLGPLLDRIAGRTFYVRVERRGHKGVLRTHDLEQALGAFLVDTLIGRGDTPTVTFDDPEVAVSVEIVGARAGISLVTRALRQRFATVRIR